VNPLGVRWPIPVFAGLPNCDMEKITGEKIYLRRLSSEDATEKYCGWINDPEVNRYLETKKIDILCLKDYINEKNFRSDCLLLGIFSKRGDCHIGNVKFEPIDFKRKETTMGLLIGDKEYWNQGIGTEAATLVVNYAFDALGLEKISLGVVLENKAAVRTYEKVGFKFEKNKPSGQGYAMMAIKKRNEPIKKN